jgi:hypothetical protein
MNFFIRNHGTVSYLMVVVVIRAGSKGCSSNHCLACQRLTPRQPEPQLFSNGEYQFFQIWNFSLGRGGLELTTTRGVDGEAEEGGVGLMRWWWVYWCLKIEDSDTKYMVWTAWSKISVLF